MKHKVGLRVKAIRVMRELTQEQLAARIDRTVETVSNIERGQTLPGLAALENLSVQLGIPLRDFFDHDPRSPSVDSMRFQTEVRLQDLIRSLSDEGVRIALRQIEALADLAGRKP